MKQQAALKARLKELEQRETHLDHKKAKFALKLEQLTLAFKELQTQKTLLHEKEDSLHLSEAVLHDKQAKFEHYKQHSLAAIKESSLRQLVERDALLKKKSKLEVTEKKLQFTEQLFAQEGANVNVNKREAELRAKEIELLQKELELEMQQQELASKIDEVNSLVNELAQWSGMPPPLEEFQTSAAFSPSVGLVPSSPSSNAADEVNKRAPVSLSSSPLQPLKPNEHTSASSIYLAAADHLQLSLENKSFYSGMAPKSTATSQVGGQLGELTMTPISGKEGAGEHELREILSEMI